MEATSTDSRSFQLTDNGRSLGELIYRNLFTLKAEIKLGNSDVYEVKPVGFFCTSTSVTKNGSEILNLKMNWRGEILFTYQDGRKFVLKTKGAFGNKFIIEDKEAQTLIQFDPKFNWSKFHYNYTITYEKKPQDILFVLLGVYASNYFISAMSGVS